jgi:hypothetical protein
MTRNIDVEAKVDGSVGKKMTSLGLKRDRGDMIVRGDDEGPWERSMRIRTVGLIIL